MKQATDAADHVRDIPLKLMYQKKKKKKKCRPKILMPSAQNFDDCWSSEYVTLNHFAFLSYQRDSSANENFNSTVWRLAPNHLHSRPKKIIEVASFSAVGLFNEGNSAGLMVMNESKIVVGPLSFDYPRKMNVKRLKRKNRRSVSEINEAWKARNVMKTLNDAYEDEEGLLYGNGIVD